MGIFITNSNEKNLKERIQKLIYHSQEMKFLVGFFYFSGIRELYENLLRLEQNNQLNQGQLKILVGLNVDEGTYGIYEGAKISNKKPNQNEVKEDYIKSLIKSFNSRELDNRDLYEQLPFFVQLLREGKLILRKTREPNHAKLYLFKIKEEFHTLVENLFITGSSNLTKAGLYDQHEFNVEIKDFGFDEAEKYFNELWAKSIDLTKYIDEILTVLKEKTFLREVTPFEAYVYILKTYIDLNKAKIEADLKETMKSKGYKPYNYQIEAVAQAYQNCIYHNGTLLADVVGLGKTIVACLLGKVLSKRGLVICPPHLIGDAAKDQGWEKYLNDFGLNDWEVRSIGKLEDALSLTQKYKFEVIVVDEAHRFRNQRTKSYHLLREICRGKTVILLTATPFNNTPSDIYSLLKLFSVPRKSTIVYDMNLWGRFVNYSREFEKLTFIFRNIKSNKIENVNRAKKFYEELFNNDKSYNIEKVKKRLHNIAEDIKGIIEPVTIRRNRLDLKYYGEDIDFPEVKDPMEVFFELTKEQSRFYDKVLETFLSKEEGGIFNGAIYYPENYRKTFAPDVDYVDSDFSEEHFIMLYQKNLYDFMRRLLVRRFESSFGAFKASLENFIDIHEKVLAFINKTGKFILDRKFMQKFAEINDPEEQEEIFKEFMEMLSQQPLSQRYNLVYNVDEMPNFVQDIKADLVLFKRLLIEFENLGFSSKDPKAEKLVEKIRDWLDQGRKVVIFSEYVDTVAYLEKVLEHHFPKILLSAYGNLSKSTIESIYQNFDAQQKVQKNTYQILLTTDKLSEGYNLNRAGVVINYDIPWNPVRVIQRVGRINRIGKKVYNEIYIQHFFPTEKGADIINSRIIAQNKMFMIHKVLGEDAKIFSPDEEPQPSLLYQHLTSLPQEEKAESFFTRIRNDLEKIIKDHPDLIRKLTDMPSRIKVAKPFYNDELLVFIRKGKDIFVGFKDYKHDRPPMTITFQNAYDKIIAQPDTPSLQLSDYFWNSYHQILDTQDAFKFTHSSGQSIETKAYNVLRTILNLKNEKLSPYYKFISDLIDDIQNFGTLSEFALQKIASWQTDESELDTLIDKIKELIDEIGENFLESVKNLPDTEQQIIIAIENQKQEANYGN